MRTLRDLLLLIILSDRYNTDLKNDDRQDSANPQLILSVVEISPVQNPIWCNLFSIVDLAFNLDAP